MPDSDFYAAGPLKQIAVNLFYGWGYNFYRKENQLRADDLLIRSKVGALLSTARKSVETAERDYRREFLPPPSRAKPQHDPAAVAGAQTIERLSKAIGALASQVNAQPVPESDRMTLRYREEAGTLKKLFEWDEILAAQSELLRTKVEQKNGAWFIENESIVREGIEAITDSLRNRQLALLQL